MCCRLPARTTTTCPSDKKTQNNKSSRIHRPYLASILEMQERVGFQTLSFIKDGETVKKSNVGKVRLHSMENKYQNDKLNQRQYYWSCQAGKFELTGNEL